MQTYLVAESFRPCRPLRAQVDRAAHQVLRPKDHNPKITTLGLLLGRPTQHIAIPTAQAGTQQLEKKQSTKYHRRDPQQQTKPTATDTIDKDERHSLQPSRPGHGAIIEGLVVVVARFVGQEAVHDVAEVAASRNQNARHRRSWC